MKPSTVTAQLEPMRAAAYRRRIAHLVDVRTEQRGRSAVPHLIVHVAVFASVNVWVALRMSTTPAYLLFPLALVSGHSMMIAAIAAHEVGHGGGVMPVWLRKLWLL